MAVDAYLQKYVQQKISGGAGGSTTGGWDLAANKVAA
jgi:type VI secretion system secreted protein Hcp